MIEIFKNLSRLYGKDGYYEIFIENPNEKTGPPEFERMASIFFGFAFLKMIDTVLKPTKEKILKEYKLDPNQNFINIATYNNGESVGFYNTSQLDIDKIKKVDNPEEALNRYIDGFSDNIKEIYEMINFKEYLKFLVEYDVLEDFLNEIYRNPKNIDFHSSYEGLVKDFHDLMYIMVHDPYYNMGFENIVNDDPYSSYYYINEPSDKLGDLLNNLLLHDINFENKDTYNIYDPNSIGAYILNKTKYAILSKNLNSNISLYGKSEKIENKIIRLAKNAITKRDSYKIDGATIIEPNQSILKEINFNSYDDFDLIVTNYIGCKYMEITKITNTLKNQNVKDTKAVFALDTLSEVYNQLNELVENDYLESLIRFKSYFIIIINTNKSEFKRGKFIYINESGLQDTKSLFNDIDRFANYKLNFDNNGSKKLKEGDLEQMDRVLNSYKKFKGSENSKIVENSEYESVRKLFYY